MKIRVLLLDFDGTSLMPNQVFLSLRNMHAIRQAIEKGVEVVPCTGRCEATVPMQIEHTKEIRYWITSNGGRVIDRRTGEVIFSSTFTPEESGYVCRLFEGQDLYSETAAAGQIYAERAVFERIHEYPVPWHHIWYLDQGRLHPVERLSEFFPKEKLGIEKVNLYGLTGEQKEEMTRRLEETGIVRVIPDESCNFQFFPKRQDRREALAALLDRLSCSPENVMSIGDGPLDVDMVEEAGFGVVTGNAPEEVKARARYVTAPYDEDGVAEAIERLIIREEF